MSTDGSFNGRMTLEEIRHRINNIMEQTKLSPMTDAKMDELKADLKSFKYEQPKHKAFRSKTLKTKRTRLKIGRNELCPCGRTGRKYKNCCLGKKKRSIIMETKKNDFRDGLEAREVTPEEMMRRDQNVRLMQLRLRKIVLGADKVHLEAMMSLHVQFRESVQALPDSDGKNAVLKALDGIDANTPGEIAKLEAQIATCCFSRPQEVILDALQKVVDNQDYLDGPKLANEVEIPAKGDMTDQIAAAKEAKLTENANTATGHESLGPDPTVDVALEDDDLDGPEDNKAD